VARRIDFPWGGDAGHFDPSAVAEMEIFVDAFHLGEVLFAEDCQERLTQIWSTGHAAAGTSGGGDSDNFSADAEL